MIQLTLQKNKFNVEQEASCDYDYLEIHDGQTENSPSLSNGKMCGNGNRNQDWLDRPNGFPTTITSTSNFVLLRFHTDGSQQKKGWQIQYRAVDRPTVGPGKNTHYILE